MGRVIHPLGTCPIRAEEKKIRNHTWKWVAGCVLLTAGIVWFARAQLASHSFDWSLAVASFQRLHWNWLALAFIPITFELTVLLGGLSTVAALFVRTRLYPGKKEQLIAEGITNDSFALVLRKRDALFNSELACELLEQCGACEIEEKEAEL